MDRADSGTIHVIILGLAIALIGAIWLWRRTPPELTALRSHIAAQQTEIANLQDGLAQALQARSRESAATQQKEYEPDMQISRIRLSDKTSRLHPWHVVPKRG